MMYLHQQQISREYLKCILRRQNPLLLPAGRIGHVKYGEYLVNMASCMTCHSKENKGEIIKGTEYGGGREFVLPWELCAQTNITTHGTGIAAYSRELFIQRFKGYLDTAYHSPKLGPTDFNTIMPWTMYAAMKPSDLAAIYAFLKTVTLLIIKWKNSHRANRNRARIKR